ncbi:MAG: hypothetical protein ACI4AQ_07570 [Lachnospiraceae bacterium]
MNTIIFLILVLVIMIYTSIRSSREIRRKNRARLIEEFSNPLSRKMDVRGRENLRNYDQLTASENPLHIDEDTWDDLNMDEIFDAMNCTNSAIGQECLYHLLHNPTDQTEQLEEIHRLAEEFTKNEDERIKIQEQFIALGYANISDAYSYIHDILDLKDSNNVMHYFAQVLIVAAFVILIFVNMNIGLLAVIGAIAYSIISYFKDKAKIESYLSSMKCIVRMVDSADSITRMDVSFIDLYKDQLTKYLKNTKQITKNFFLINTGSGYTGSLLEIGLDYMRILFHVDLIRFNQLTAIIKEHQAEIMDIYKTLGFIESCIAIAAYRNKLPYWCMPKLREDRLSKEYHVTEVYHPLLENPIANSIKTKECILLTGSNASGKSTFLRAIAVNALLSQTIATSPSKSYYGSYYRIISSMSHKDNLTGGDSYYMVEIKALKRILDQVKNPGQPVLCFLDEVLRGTNTVERIAASTQILKSFVRGNVLCFAATHDIELTQLLAGGYANYHFEESFENNDVQYNYLLKEGPAVTRNAIRLLAQTGYDQDLIDEAVWMTKEFETNGIWKAKN